MSGFDEDSVCSTSRMPPLSLRMVVFECDERESQRLPSPSALPERHKAFTLVLFGWTAHVFISMQISKDAETKLIISSRVETTGGGNVLPIKKVFRQLSYLLYSFAGCA